MRGTWGFREGGGWTIVELDVGGHFGEFVVCARGMVMESCVACCSSACNRMLCM